MIVLSAQKPSLQLYFIAFTAPKRIDWQMYEYVLPIIEPVMPMFLLFSMKNLEEMGISSLDWALPLLFLQKLVLINNNVDG